MSRRVNGAIKHRTLGRFSGPGSVTSDTARKVYAQIMNEFAAGVDRVEVHREQKKIATEEGRTLFDLVEEYVKVKRRPDGLELKESTKEAYLDMVLPGNISKSGKPFANGHLYCIANKPAVQITAADVWDIYNAERKKSKRQTDYAMQVLRAVLRWNGIMIPNSPLSIETAGKHRIVIPGHKKKPHPIPLAQLGAWWNAATFEANFGRMEKSRIGADGLRFMLLTGLRSGEVFGSKKHQTGLLVGQVNQAAKMMTSPDTKNRRDFDVMMPSQAIEILKVHCKDKLPLAKVFDVKDPGKTLATINKRACVIGISPHKLRHTFASVAEDLVSAYTLKAMLNHISDAGATGGYVGKSEAQLTKGWQAVADFIIEAGSESDRLLPEQVA
jgi:integrase